MKKNKQLDVTVDFTVNQTRTGDGIVETVVRPRDTIELSWSITLGAIIFELYQDGHPQTREAIKSKIRHLALDRIDELFDSVTVKPYARLPR